MYKYDVFGVVNLFLNHMCGVVLLNCTKEKKRMQSLHVCGDCRGGDWVLCLFQIPETVQYML